MDELLAQKAIGDAVVKTGLTKRATCIFFDLPFLHRCSKAAMIAKRFRNYWPSQRQIDNDRYSWSQPRGSAPRSDNGAMPTGISCQFYAGYMIDKPMKSDENRVMIPGPAGAG